MTKEQINHPAHYNSYSVEAIDMIIAVYGIQKAIDWCEITALKYRLRLGLKDDVAQDLAKEKWYLEKCNELKKML